jgi:hypothetical protein
VFLKEVEIAASKWKLHGSIVEPKGQIFDVTYGLPPN